MAYIPVASAKRYVLSQMIVLVCLCGAMNFAVGADSKWESVLTDVDVSRDAVAGTWTKSGQTLTVGAAQGARIALAAAPAREYDFRASFTRKTGQHSIGLIFVHGGKQVVFEVDAWGSHLAGFQDIAGKSIRDNPSKKMGIRLENNRQYSISVEVRKDSIRGLLDGKEICRHQTSGDDLQLHAVWAMPDASRLGLVAWESETVFESVEVRSAVEMTTASTSTSTTAPGTRPTTEKPVSGKSSTAAAKKPASQTAKSPTVAGRSSTKSAPEKPASAKSTSGERAQATPTATPKHVLIIIASHHFFYREYGDPREELERAGFKVTVAAGRKAPAHPHPGSGQGADGGVVQPDFALKDVQVDDYDAVLFSGGWGSSMYQFAFPGRYQEAAYNGDRATKTEANRIINEFIAQDKYVCALCNGVTVLAWARVNGKSPLAGKRVCAPTRQAAPGIYNGRPGQPSCRWHPEANGAIMSPAGSIGQPGSAADDVLVDGKIITGEDDISAREMGRRIVEVLSE